MIRHTPAQKEYNLKHSNLLYLRLSVVGDSNAETFRAFWGERSQLRRFQDGVVKEVVVWGDKSEEIIGEVVVAVVARHHPGVEVEEQADWHRFIPLIAKT